LDEQYGSIIANAEKLFAAKTLDQAKSGYQKALELKPAEELPNGGLHPLTASVM